MEIVVMTTYDANSDNKVGTMMTLGFQYIDTSFW